MRLLLSLGKEPTVSAYCFPRALLTVARRMHCRRERRSGIVIVARRVCFGNDGQAVHGVAVARVGAAGSGVCRKAERSSPWTRLLSCDRSGFAQRRSGLEARDRLGKKPLRFVAMDLHLWYNCGDRM